MIRSAPRVAPALLSFFLCAAAGFADAQPIGSDCAAVIRAKVECSNADEICTLLLAQAAPGTGGNLDGVYDFETMDLGDGTTGYVFRYKTSGDPLAVQPNYTFVLDGGRLAVAFDGQGSPARYAKTRSKVNGRWQVERVVEANVPGLYRKREVETWFWPGSGTAYVRAFTRVTIEGAADPKLNGTKMLWNADAEEPYRKAGTSWTYTVKAGDTLGAIARKQRVSADEILRQNGIGSGATLRIGQALRYESWKVNAR